MTLVIISFVVLGAILIGAVLTLIFNRDEFYPTLSGEGAFIFVAVFTASVALAVFPLATLESYYIGSVRELRLFEEKRALLSNIDESLASSSDLINQRYEANMWLAENQIRRERLGDIGYIREEIMDVKPIE